jgi:diamine N-acetyltransferase
LEYQSWKGRTGRTRREIQNGTMLPIQRTPSVRGCEQMRSALKPSGTNPVIRQLDADIELRTSARIIRRSFKTVADDFGLTRENCPGHTAFLTTKSLRNERDHGLKCFGLFSDQRQVGFVGIEQYEPETLVRPGDREKRYWLEKLAVLPSYRHQGYGEMLVDFAVQHVLEGGGTCITLGMMNEHSVLKRWYLGRGFGETELKKFAHLPFVVCFMEKSLRPV